MGHGVDAQDYIKADFALICTDNGMIGAGIAEGDVLYVQFQDNVENGDIAVLHIDGLAMVRRVYYSGDYVLLMADNQSYDPIAVDAADIEIIGRVTSFIHGLDKKGAGECRN